MQDYEALRTSQMLQKNRVDDSTQVGVSATARREATPQPRVQPTLPTETYVEGIAESSNHHHEGHEPRCRTCHRVTDKEREHILQRMVEDDAFMRMCADMLKKPFGTMS
ncbi:uncharacterized protein KRP23_13168 [Phytophthora ramorum]|uniref:uncharacterized protein n=1 Tax=Phytophthora ramorum TaxID=164328 RepID=UPI003097832E|nr:hypothetical protein KRP23_13168 [Phytophthora ramorum]